MRFMVLLLMCEAGVFDRKSIRSCISSMYLTLARGVL